MLSRVLKVAIIILTAAVPLSTGCSPANQYTTTAAANPYKIPVSVEYPAETPPRLKIKTELPGMIRMIGDDGSEFISGTIEVNDPVRAPVIESRENTVSLVQGDGTDIMNLAEMTNLWKLRVSDRAAFSLEIHNPQAEGHWNLSGLPITELDAELGTAKNAFTFDQPNPVVMQRAEFQGNTGPVVIEGILNAACRELVVLGRVGELTIRFGGTLRENCQVSVQTGTGIVTITVSPDTPARIVIAGPHPVTMGEGLMREDTENGKLVFETTAYHVNHNKALEIEINGTPTQVYLNPPS